MTMHHREMSADWLLKNIIFKNNPQQGYDHVEEFVFKSQVQSSPDNANLEFSAIRMRMTINGVQCLLRPLRPSLHFGT